jgi:hypothetical protein
MAVGSMGPRYILQLLFIENHKIANNPTTTNTREIQAHIWNP